MIENYANFVAIVEMYFGNAIDFKDVLFFVIGTGMGGSIIVDQKLHRGKNFLAGETNCMVFKDLKTNIWKNISTLTGMDFLKRTYTKISGKKKLGKEIYQLYSTNINAKKIIDIQIENIAKIILNTSFVLDSELILLGGAASKNSFFRFNKN